jgi:predicted nucleic acid-binding Zn ribbon protein
VPLYEYRRPDGSTFDVLQSFSDEPLTVDPDTGVPVERVLHAPALHFKGTGFYSTDVGREKQRKMLQRSAEQGANDHDDKMRAQRAERTKAKKKP